MASPDMRHGIMLPKSNTQTHTHTLKGIESLIIRAEDPKKAAAALRSFAELVYMLRSFRHAIF